MNELFNSLDYVRTYDLLLISNKFLEDHIKKLDIVLSKLILAGFKVNAENSLFTRNELEYLGFKITREGKVPLPDKVEAKKIIAVPIIKTQLYSFIAVISYNRDMWKHRSGISTPLSCMTFKNKLAKLNWSKECKKTFDRA